MGEKDLTQKNLEAFPDVFADCVNALLYEGEAVLRGDNLTPAPTETVYPDAKNRLHSQLQDISKYEIEDNTIRTQYTIENQTGTDLKMVLRKSGYEGAIYRGQYARGEVYPVISMLLYWGADRWQGPRSLSQLMEMEGLLSDKKRNYVDDIQLHVYEMAHLPPEVRARFQSDMRIVVDCLAEKKGYMPTGQKIVHGEALLRTLKALTGDTRYEKILEKLTKENRMEEMEMCEFLDAYFSQKWEQGIAQGIQQGIAQGIEQGIEQGIAQGIAQGIERGIEQGKWEKEVENIRSMHQHQLTAQVIAELIDQKLEYINQILQLIFRYPSEDNRSIVQRLLAGE